jgi:hypothetical protein
MTQQNEDQDKINQQLIDVGRTYMSGVHSIPEAQSKTSDPETCPTCKKRAKDLFQSDTAYERVHCSDPWHKKLCECGQPKNSIRHSYHSE